MKSIILAWKFEKLIGYFIITQKMKPFIWPKVEPTVRIRVFLLNFC